jgi:hypothetical protein
MWRTRVEPLSLVEHLRPCNLLPSNSDPVSRNWWNTRSWLSEYVYVVDSGNRQDERYDGARKLTEAASVECKEGTTVKVLVDDDLSPFSLTFDGDDALRWAASQEYSDILRVLQYRQVTIHPTTMCQQGGITALHFAIFGCHIATARFLIRKGVHPIMVTLSGFSCLRTAAELESKIIVQLSEQQVRDGWTSRVRLDLSRVCLQVRGMVISLGIDQWRWYLWTWHRYPKLKESRDSTSRNTRLTRFDIY